MPRIKAKSNRDLRKFGLLMGGALLIIGCVLIWRERWTGPYVIILSAFFLCAGLLFPRVLAPIERIWMAFARVLGAVMTFAILSLTFFLIITPMGFILRLFGKDLLQRKFDSRKQSYWIAVEPDGPCSRPDKPY
jgi:hypothetical protein